MAVNAAQPSPLTLTFEQVRDRYFEKLGTPQPDALSRLQRYATALNARPIAAITPEQVADVLKAAGWNGNKGHTAARLRAHIEAVLSANDLIGPEKNPASWARLKHQPALRVEEAAKTVNRESLEYRRAPELMATLDDSVKARALRFLILTAARIDEVVGMTWREIDLKQKLWTIPAARMKARRVHVVPLSDAALACLGHGGADDALIFAVSEKTTLRLAQKFAPGITQHGFRASFSTWAQEQDEGRTYTPTVIEAALAHAKGGGDATSAASPLDHVGS
jgi:integrase